MSHPASWPSHRSPPSPLRLRRLTLGLTQAEVADEARRSREQIGRLEAGTCVPTWPTVQRLSTVLRAAPDELFPLESVAALIDPSTSEAPGGESEGFAKSTGEAVGDALQE